MELVQSIKDNYTLLGDIIKLSDELIYLFKKQDFYNGIHFHSNIIKLVEETFQIYSVDDTFYTELENTIKSLLMAQ